MTKSECKGLKIKLNVDSMESVDFVDFVENMELVENVDSMESVDLTGILRTSKSQLYCSFDVALMQLCYYFDVGLVCWEIYGLVIGRWEVFEDCPLKRKDAVNLGHPFRALVFIVASLPRLLTVTEGHEG